jgi:hypothetical protein
VRKSLHCDCEQEKWGHEWVSVCVHRGASTCQISVTKCDISCQKQRHKPHKGR